MERPSDLVPFQGEEFARIVAQKMRQEGGRSEFRPPVETDSPAIAKGLRLLEGMALLKHKSPGTMPQQVFVRELKGLAADICIESGYIIPEGRHAAQAVDALERALDTTRAMINEPLKPEHGQEAKVALAAAKNAGYDPSTKEEFLKRIHRILLPGAPPPLAEIEDRFLPPQKGETIGRELQLLEGIALLEYRNPGSVPQGAFRKARKRMAPWLQNDVDGPDMDWESMETMPGTRSIRGGYAVSQLLEKRALANTFAIVNHIKPMNPHTMDEYRIEEMDALDEARSNGYGRDAVAGKARS